MIRFHQFDFEILYPLILYSSHSPLYTLHFTLYSLSLTSSSSSSSRDLPFVSGQFLSRNVKAQMHIAEYIQKEPLLPSTAFIGGKEKVSVQQPTHRAKVHLK